MPAARVAIQIARLGTRKTAQAMDARRTQINRHAERHPADRLSLKGVPTDQADLACWP
jgi:hypothetical protein